MAFPPAPLPINKTNATPQQNDHAATHNAIGQAMNDTVQAVTDVNNYAININTLANENKAGIVRHETHPVVTKSFAAGSATNLNPAVGPITLTTIGMYFVHFSVDLAPPAAGWGYATFYPSLVTPSSAIGVVLVHARRYETPSANERAQVNGLWAIHNTGPLDVYIRTQCYASSVPYNSIDVTAWCLYTGGAA